MQKITNLQHWLTKQNKYDALIIHKPATIQSIAGFKSSNALLIITSKKVWLITDQRYLSAAKAFFRRGELELASTEKHTRSTARKIQILDFEPLDRWHEWFQKNKITKAGAVKSMLMISQLKGWQKRFGIKVYEAGDIILKTASQKSDQEISACQKACQIADQALQQTLPKLKVGVTEAEIAWQLEKAGRELGATGVSFDPIIAFGPNSALPHHHPGNTKLQKNMPILIDWGFVADDMCSDCTRCFWFGDTPDPEWVEMYDKVLAAQAAGLQKIKAGSSISNVQKTAEKSLGEKMIHSFGHGVGNKVHEYPGVSTRTKGRLLEHQLITAEPGLYEEGKFGIRIEDLVVVTKEGYEVLTKSDKAYSVPSVKSISVVLIPT